MGDITYYHADGLGSVVATTNQAGTVVSTRRYDPWGNLEASASEPGYAFTGREWDPETGLYYYRARYYDPKAARFISADPIAFEGGVNFYAYVGGNPATLVDPFGLVQQAPRFPTSGYLPGTRVRYRMDLRQSGEFNMHVYWPNGKVTIINPRGRWLEEHAGKKLFPALRQYRARLRPVTRDFMKRCRAIGRASAGLAALAFLLDAQEAGAAEAMKGLVDSEAWPAALFAEFMAQIFLGVVTAPSENGMTHEEIDAMWRSLE